MIQFPHFIRVSGFLFKSLTRMKSGALPSPWVSLSPVLFTYTLTNTLHHQVTIVRKRLSLSIPQLLLCICLLCAFTGALGIFASHSSQDKRFRQFTTRLFREEMTASTLNMHYTIADPKAFGISEYEPVLPVYRPDQQENGKEHCIELLKQLDRIDPDSLSRENADTYRLLRRSLENDLALAQFPYYNEPLSPSSGMQSQLPVLLAEYTFRTKRDVTDYLALLDQVDDYFASLLLYEQEKAAAGLLMPASSLKKVRKQCDTIVTSQELTQGTHFLQTTFEDRLLELQKQGLFTPEETASLIEKNDHLLATVVQPAYAAMSEGLLSLETSASADTGSTALKVASSAHDALPKGLALLPDGKTYYRHLRFSETGSSRSEKELVQMLLEKFREDQSAIRSLAAQSPSLISLLSEGISEDFPLTQPEEMLTDLQGRMKNDFPVSNPLPSVTVKDVVPSLEPYSAPAFYLTTPLGDSDNNVIYINQRNSPQGLELYTTLAHEGFPGHLYQTVYSNRAFLNRNADPARKLIWYGGYLEGWALYVEFLSYDYAADLLEQVGNTDAAQAARLEKHTRSLQLCMYTLLDLLIHGEGAGYDQVAEVLEKFGIDSPQVCEAIYTYIAEEPCNYPKYYIGYLEILKLRYTAESHWGDTYSDLKFHTFYLEQGTSDFSTLEDLLLMTN